MESALKSFERRQRAVAQKHRKLAQGYVTKINRNGVFEHRPIRRISPVRLRGLLLTILGFLVFKGVMLANLGSDHYAEHLARLSDGSFADKLGAWVLGVDPVTLWIGIGLQALLG
ncbi:hypothetical protein AYJ57_05890 [Salipiger sp. CCB-MM3]|uniref:hypothetical protein n=1 Tax=Salipiger sp. CCB-MM3 TaxID=1792508 RepID=UPI00080AB9A5|nr:hypothetical protein [Salipiger sp. CCB-MM3]ANT59942.1 hypothetical protein AYJ57_05890 [Salipiger sp. CCB-MM3]